MPCYHPIEGYRSRTVNPTTGKRSIVFKISDGYPDLRVAVACGRCIGCRLDKAHAWAVRMMHEAQLHEKNAFITLTYAPEHLPEDHSLKKQDFQLFMKRLRKKRKGQKIKFYHCGEYGENLGRPHYHACLFNVWFPDAVKVKDQNGRRTYKSDELEKIWGKGFCTVQHLTHESAAYCASYVTKKVTGDRAKEHYRVEVVDEQTGELTGPFDLEPEYATMSLRPAIGKGWYEKYKGETYPEDFVITGQGRKAKPPRYYDKLFREENPSGMTEVERRRHIARLKRAKDNTEERLRVKEKVKLAKLNQKSRRLEKL